MIGKVESSSGLEAENPALFVAAGCRQSSDANSTLFLSEISDVRKSDEKSPFSGTIGNYRKSHCFCSIELSFL